MKHYDSETLKKVQKYELSILKDFVKICDENNLTYFGIAGTGIGAVRHGGFIPWDDDIDVGILREDLYKLIEIIERDYSDKYYILNAENDKNFPLTTTYMCIKGSSFVPESLKQSGCPYGLFLDLFPFDKVAKDEKTFKKQMKTPWLFSKLLILRHLPFPVVPFYGFTKKLAHIATATVHFFMKLFHISHDYLYSKIKTICCKNNDDPNPDAYAFFCGTRVYNNYFKTEDLFPLKKLKFEDIEINFPNNLEKSLTYIYGDYMQLPPEEKRKNHFPYILKFPEETTTKGGLK